MRLGPIELEKLVLQNDNLFSKVLPKGPCAVKASFSMVSLVITKMICESLMTMPFDTSISGSGLLSQL